MSGKIELPGRDVLFPFEYSGGGYFRRRGVPAGDVAEILHGQQAIDYLLNTITKLIQQDAHTIDQA